MGVINSTLYEKDKAKDNKANKIKKHRSQTMTQDLGGTPKEKKESDSASSEEDADKFIAAAQANAARLSEKKKSNRLSPEKLGIRKNTIDLES